MFNFNGKTASLIARRPLVSVTAVKRNDFRDVGKWPFNRLFSVAWLAAVQISWDKKKFLHEKTQKSLTSPGLFRVHQHGRRFIVLYTNMATVTSCENDL